MPGEGGQPERAVRHGRLPVVDAVDIDEQLRAGEPEVEQRHQALAACQHLGVVTAFREQAHRLVVAVGCHVLERRCDHRAARQFAAADSRATAASSTAWLLVITGSPSRAAMAGLAAIAPKFVHEAKTRPMLAWAASRPSARSAKATMSSCPTWAIAKFSEIPSPAIAATRVPSASMLALIFSFSSSTYGVITPTLAAPDSAIAALTAPIVDTVGAPVTSLIRAHSSAS